MYHMIKDLFRITFFIVRIHINAIREIYLGLDRHVKRRKVRRK